VTGNANFAAAVKREYFPYFTQGKKITINAIQLHAIKDDELPSITASGHDLQELTTALNDAGAFQLSLAPDPDVLVREQQAHVFILIKYSLESA